MINDDYKILGISKDASISEIKKAYRKKAFESHPDRIKLNDVDSEEYFKDLNTAYHNILQTKGMNEEKEENFIVNISPFSELIVKRKNLDDEMDIFDFFESNLFTNIFNRESLFSTTNARPRRMKTTINTNSCFCRHDKFTICLKCGNY